MRMVLDLKKAAPKTSPAAPEEWRPIPGRPGFFESTKHRNPDGSPHRMFSPSHEYLYPSLYAAKKKAAP